MGSSWLARQLGDPRVAGYPVHTADSTGTILQSFGTDTPQHRPDLRLITTRMIGPAPDGLIWTAAPGRYVLEKWDPVTGTKHARIEVDSDWFEASVHLWKSGERPHDVITALWEDEDNRVWVVFRTADEQWVPPAPSGDRDHRPSDPADADRDYDTVIEVIDVTSGQVIASQRFDKRLDVHPQDRILASVNVDDPTLVAYDLWTASIQYEPSIDP